MCNVRMVQRGQHLRLPLEARHPLRVTGKRRRQHLDRHIPLQPHIPRAVHLSHAARSELPYDLVSAYLRPRQNRSHIRARLYANSVAWAFPWTSLSFLYVALAFMPASWGWRFFVRICRVPHLRLLVGGVVFLSPEAVILRKPSLSAPSQPT